MIFVICVNNGLVYRLVTVCVVYVVVDVTVWAIRITIVP